MDRQENNEQKMGKMKFINFLHPALTGGKHTVTVTQEVQSPTVQTFTATEEFYVAGRGYTLDVSQIFSESPTENECGDFSKLIPFLTLENQTFPWDRKITQDMDEIPVPWVALIVISSREEAKEEDISIFKLLEGTTGGVFSPDPSALPQVVTEKNEDLCHVVEIPVSLYKSIMPSYRDLPYLTHVRRVNLADTEDAITAKDGEFSVIMANRLIPTGEEEPLKSTVHLVSLLGLPETIPKGFDSVRLVSLHRWNVYSVRDHSQTFQQLIDTLKENTGVVGFDRTNEVLARGHVPKKHKTRSGEFTYSLYRSPLIPYANRELDCTSKQTADGHLIYDPTVGIFDVSYAAAFQLGRFLSLSRRADGSAIAAWRKSRQSKEHKQLLKANMQIFDVGKLCEAMVENMKESKVEAPRRGEVE